MSTEQSSDSTSPQFQSNSESIQAFTNTQAFMKTPEKNNYSTPSKTKNENKNSSNTCSSISSIDTSSAKKHLECCLSKEFLERLNECSPAKPLALFVEEEEKKDEHDFLKNYLLENYECKENIPPCNAKRKLCFNGENKKILEKYPKKMKKKTNFEREGDWECIKCRNINFSFRKFCNKCKIKRSIAEKSHYEIAGNLLEILSFN